MRSPRTPSRRAGVPLLGSVWALAGLATAILLIGASLTLLGRDVLDFSDWQSYQESQGPAVAAPAAPVSVSASSRTDRDTSAARTAPGGDAPAPDGAAAASAPSQVRAGTPAPSVRRTAPAVDGDSSSGGTRRADTQPREGRVTPLAPAGNDIAGGDALPGLEEEQAPSVVEVDIAGSRYAVPEGGSLEVRVRGGRPGRVTAAPAQPAPDGPSP